jgi:DNA-directed RNA polymerase sigma subunit (sigma70/sigma32)
VLQLRFGLEDGQPRSLADVGQRLGMSRERARQLESAGLRTLRRALHPLRPLLAAE